MTLCSKETWSYKDAGYPKLDENTVIKTADGPEKDIPNFYIEKIRHTDDCYYADRRQNSKHYFILAKLKE